MELPRGSLERFMEFEWVRPWFAPNTGGRRTQETTTRVFFSLFEKMELDLSQTAHRSQRNLAGRFTLVDIRIDRRFTLVEKEEKA